MSILKCALKMTVKDLGFDDLSRQKRLIEDGLIISAEIVGIVMIPFIVIASITTHVILFLSSIVWPELYLFEINSGFGFPFISTMIGTLVGFACIWPIIIFSGNIWVCYKNKNP